MGNFHSIPFPSPHSHSHSHETGVAIPTPWDSHGTHGTQGNSQYRLISICTVLQASASCCGYLCQVCACPVGETGNDALTDNNGDDVALFARPGNEEQFADRPICTLHTATVIQAGYTLPVFTRRRHAEIAQMYIYTACLRKSNQNQITLLTYCSPQARLQSHSHYFVRRSGYEVL